MRDWFSGRSTHGRCPRCRGPILLRRRDRGGWYEVPSDTMVVCPSCGQESSYRRFLEEAEAEEATDPASHRDPSS